MLNKKALSATAQVEKDDNFKQTVLLLHGDGTNGAQNNTFTDSSTNSFTITRNGNPTQGSFSPFSPTGWSNYFDGTGDYLSFASNSAFQMGTGSFTLEFWLFYTGPANAGGTNPCVFATEDLNTSTGFQVYCDGNTSSGTGKLRAQIGSGAGEVDVDTAGGALKSNTWTHFALVRNGSSVQWYVDGAISGSSQTASTNLSTSAAVKIGDMLLSTTHFYFTGYISNLRLVKGTAVYTAAFTTPTTALTAITNTSLLTCQSNRFIDNSTNAFSVTVNGNPSVQAFSPFAPTAAYSAGTNGGSGYFDGTDDYLTIPDNSAFDFGSGDFTIECWYYMLPGAETATNGRWIVSKWQTDNTTFSWGFRQEIGGGEIGKLRFYLKFPSGTTTLEASAVQQVNTWYHIAAVRNGSTLTMYINGVSDASTTVSGAVSVSTTKVAIGEGQLNNGAEAYWLGYISGLRVIKGTAQYTTGFTPPTTPPTAVTNTQLLTNFTNAGIYDSTAKNDLETVGDAQIDTTTKKFGTGSMKFDGTGDYLIIPSNQNLYLGSGNFTVEGWFRTASASTLQSIVNIWSSSPTQFQIEINASGNIQCSWAPYSTAAYLITGSTAISANTWYHFAFVRNGSTFTLYLNGTSDGTGTSSATTTNNAPLYIGINNGSSLNRAFNGYIDDLRITKGVARYTANFTVPSKAFADQ